MGDAAAAALIFLSSAAEIVTSGSQPASPRASMRIERAEPAATTYSSPTFAVKARVQRNLPLRGLYFTLVGGWQPEAMVPRSSNALTALARIRPPEALSEK